MEQWSMPSDDAVTTMVVMVPIDDLERACDVVWTHGAYGFEERAIDEQHVELVLGPDDALARALSDADTMGRWTTRYEQTSSAALEQWRQWAEPVWIDDQLVVEPAWTPQRVDPAGPGQRAFERIIIDPEASFGMGDHPTTLLCARALRQHLVGNPAERPTVLDVGCGSGVLSIVALVSGSGPVTAIDLSAAAVETTRRNGERNGVEIEAATTPLCQIADTFDIVVANLLAPIIDELADHLIEAVSPGGILIVSGLLERQLNTARERLSAPGLLLETARASASGWGSLSFLKPTDGSPS